MAPKKAIPAPENQPSASSSSADEQSDSEEILNKNKDEGSEPEEDEEEQSGDDEEEKDENDEDEKDEKTNAQNPTPKPQSSSDTENASGSESESEPSPTASDFAIKPISSKPMDKPKKPTPKPGTKRPAKDQNGKDGSSQNKKTKVDDEKKPSTLRLWSEDDEVAILKGVLDFKAKKGYDPYTDMGSFLEFIKKDLSFSASKSQLWDKSRRLKKKYQACFEKRQNDEDPVFNKPYEYKSYQLYKKIWGNDSNTVEGTAKSATTKRKATKPGKFENSLASPIREPKTLSLPEKKSNGVDGKTDEEDFYSMFPELVGSLEAENMNLSVPEAVVNVVKDTMPLIGAVKAKELEGKWKNLRAEQIRLFLKQLDLVREQTKMALDAMEASNS